LWQAQATRHCLACFSKKYNNSITIDLLPLYNSCRIISIMITASFTSIFPVASKIQGHKNLQQKHYLDEAIKA
jgi:hypothetical protein